MVRCSIIVFSNTPDGDAQYGDLRDTLYEAAVGAGVTFQYGSDATSVDLQARAVTCSDGACYTADVVIAADGVAGIGRKLLKPCSGAPWQYTVYRSVPFCAINSPF